MRTPCASVFFFFVRACIESHTLPLCPPRKSKIKSHTCACGPLSGLRTSSRRLRAFPSHPSCPRIPFPDCVRRLACLNHFYRMWLVELVSIPAASAAVRGRGGCQGRYGYIHSNGAAVCWNRNLVWRHRSRQNHSRQFETHLRDRHIESTECDERDRNEGLQTVPHAGWQCHQKKKLPHEYRHYESPQCDRQRRPALPRHLRRRLLCRQLGDL